MSGSAWQFSIEVNLVRIVRFDKGVVLSGEAASKALWNFGELGEDMRSPARRLT